MYDLNNSVFGSVPTNFHYLIYDDIMHHISYIFMHYFTIYAVNLFLHKKSLQNMKLEKYIKFEK